MRAFLSINLDSSVRDAMGRIQEQLAQRSRAIRWIPAENCHLTLKFFGEIPESVIPVMAEAMGPAAAGIPSFPLQIGGLGTFPPRGAPAIVWIGVQRGEANLVALEQAVREALVKAEIGFDRKPFTPHITIGRAKRGERAHCDLEPYRTVAAAEMRVEAIHLMQSTLNPQGAVYAERARYALGDEERTPGIVIPNE